MTLAELELPGRRFTIRKAESCDVASIVGLLAADQLRASVDSIAIEHRNPYDLAFQAIDADPAQLLLVVVSTENEVVGTMQRSQKGADVAHNWFSSRLTSPGSQHTGSMSDLASKRRT
ncbi:hypothetical protein [Arthrobacter sp. 131MFCol6.1]|uniref:hypothetical protein n=1 Tax=Arthrobacter sp. 131MFCol6.1 TaxID=1157944 RepID=UPI002F2B63C1